VKRLLVAAIFGLLQTTALAAEEPPAGDTSKPGDATPNPDKVAPKEEPVKKTEYDKLPLPQLIAKAKSGDPVAQFELASRFNYGRGMPRNTAEALRWLRQAGRNGQEDAARLLAIKFYNGHDVPQDFGEALKWAGVLAEKGDLPAQLMLASMYANGEGGTRDLVRAYMWYAIAAVGAKREGSTEEPRAVQVQAATEARDKLATLLSEVQETEAQRLASDWWMKKHGTSGKAREK